MQESSHLQLHVIVKSHLVVAKTHLSYYMINSKLHKKVSNYNNCHDAQSLQSSKKTLETHKQTRTEEFGVLV